MNSDAGGGNIHLCMSIKTKRRGRGKKLGMSWKVSIVIRAVPPKRHSLVCITFQVKCTD
jgi:hypothetical protein